MLNLKDITLSTLDDPIRQAVVVTADIRYRSAMMVDNWSMFASRRPMAVLNMAKERVVRELWHKLYGDLCPPMQELNYHVHLGVYDPYRPNLEAEALCSRLLSKLSYPKVE